jgi:hypothetical protein
VAPLISSTTLSTHKSIPTSVTLDVYDFLGKLPPCHNDLPSTENFAPLISDCLVRTFSETPLVMQARGGLAMDGNRHTSPDDVRAMKAINKDLDGPLLINATELDWDRLKRDFNVNRYEVWETSLFLYENAENILRGHPCAMTETTEEKATSNAHDTRMLCLGWDDRAHQMMLEEVAKRDIIATPLSKAAFFNQQKRVATSKAKVSGHPQTPTTVR